MDTNHQFLTTRSAKSVCQSCVKTMPIYEYTCKDCDTRFEALRSFSKADEVIACENCQGENTYRVVSAAFAHSGGRIVSGGSSNGGCGSCAGGSCSSCGH